MRGVHAARAALLLGSGLVASSPAAAGDLYGSTDGAGAQTVSLSEYDEARMPSGLASLCVREPELCGPVTPAPQTLALTAAQLRVITSVNESVNRSISSTTDKELYGRLEYWTLPQQAGDCEDYVLLKRKMLAAQGIPLASLLITVVHDENGEGHAVLSIPSTGGDLVLDNRRDEVLHWQSTGYRFVKRQSAANPSVWVSLAREELQATNMASGPEAPPSD